MKFAFDLRQRVIMPNSEGKTQGVIVGAVAAIGMENIYSVTALMSDGKAASVSYGEDDLLLAQPQPEAVKTAKAKR